MSESTLSLPEFLKSKVADRFRDMVAKSEQRLTQATREIEELRGAQGSIGWEVGDDPPVKWFANIAKGDMTIAEEPADEPFMTVVLSTADWNLFVSGSAPGGLFAGDDRPLGKTRIERVRAIKGSMRFVLTGLPAGADFTATLHFGNERAPEPKATVQMPAEVATRIQSGILNPQAAFMQGQMKLIGDMGFAMQLGMALFL